MSVEWIHGVFKKALPILFAGAGLLLSSCASTSVPAEHLYLLPLPAAEGRPAGGKVGRETKNGPFLVVPPVKGTGLFRGNLLWARVSEMEVEPWVRHRWALPAPEVVHQALLSWARKTGAFSDVTDDPSFGGDSRIVLHVRLTALEEVDGPAGAHGRVRLELEAERTDVAGERRSVFWRGVVEEREPVRGRDAGDVVRALGRAFRRGMDRVLEEWGREGFLEKGGGE